MCGAKCLTPVTATDNFLTCHNGMCRVKFHLKCTDVPSAIYEAMKKTQSIVYRCSRCRATDESSMQMFQKIWSKLMSMDKKQDETYQKIDDRIGKLEKTTVEKSAEIKEICENEESSWSQVVKEKKNKKKNPVIIVHPKDKAQKSDQTRKSVTATINADDYEIRGVKKAAGGGVIIECANEADCDKLQKEVQSKLGEKLEAKIPEKRLPKVKVLRIAEYDKSDEELVADLKRQNPVIKDDDFKVIKREEIKQKGNKIDAFNAVLQVTGETHKKLMKDNKLRCGWNICKVVDNVYIMRCYKCLGFSHKASECKNKSSCHRCSSENHKKEECTAEMEKCVNCIRTNQALHLNLDTNHNVWSNKCPVYQKKLEISKRGIHYSE